MNPLVLLFLVILGLAIQMGVIALGVVLGTEKIRTELTALREALTSTTPSP